MDKFDYLTKNLPACNSIQACIDMQRIDPEIGRTSAEFKRTFGNVQ